jgi:hypothetical protein
LEIEFEVVDDLAVGTDRSSRAPTVAAAAVLALVAGGLGVVALVDSIGDEGQAAPPVVSDTTTTTTTVVEREVASAGVVAELEMPSYEGIVVPSFPSATGRGVERIDRSILDRAVERSGFDMPRRSSTRVSLGYGGFQVDVTVLRDPVSDRFELTVDSGEGPSTAIVDADSGLTYFTTDGRRWSSFDTVDIAARFGLSDIGELYQRLLVGPLRPDTIDLAELAVTDPVVADDGDTLGGFRVRLPADAVPLWRVHHFAPVSEFDPRGWPTSMVYDVYVSDDVEVVTGVSDIGGVPQLVEHEIERLPARVPITLPGVAPSGTR